MYSAQNNQDNIQLEIAAAYENELKESFLIYKKFLDLFKENYDPVYIDIAKKIGYLSETKETMRKCDQLIYLINSILIENHSIFSNVPVDTIPFYYESIEGIFSDVFHNLSKQQPPSGEIAWHYKRGLNYISKNFGDNISELTEKNMLTEILLIKRLTSIADTIDTLYNVFKSYGFIRK